MVSESEGKKGNKDCARPIRCHCRAIEVAEAVDWASAGVRSEQTQYHARRATEKRSERPRFGADPLPVRAGPSLREWLGYPANIPWRLFRY